MPDLEHRDCGSAGGGHRLAGLWMHAGGTRLPGATQRGAAGPQRGRTLGAEEAAEARAQPEQLGVRGVHQEGEVLVGVLLVPDRHRARLEALRKGGLACTPGSAISVARPQSLPRTAD